MLGVEKSRRPPTSSMFLSHGIVAKNDSYFYNHVSRQQAPQLSFPFSSSLLEFVDGLRCIEPSRHLLAALLVPSEDLRLVQIAPARPRFVLVTENKAKAALLPFTDEASVVDSKNESPAQFPSPEQHLDGAHHCPFLSSRRDTRTGQFKGSVNDAPSNILSDTWEVQPPPLGPLSSKRSTLTEETTAMSFFSTNNSSGSKKNEKASTRFRPYQSENWMERYSELVKFHRQHGHCLVPNTYKENPSLAEWVKRQRYQYKLKTLGRHTNITPERIQKLEVLGFVWNSHDQLWEEQLNNMKVYMEINGDCNVPYKYPPDPALATWVKRQRRQYKLMVEGKDSSMTLYRFKTLRDIGFFGKDVASTHFRTKRQS